ncbi:UvrABC system protein [Dirofilaria immitis]
MLTHCTLTVFMSAMIILPSSNGYVLGGDANAFRCCPSPCLSQVSSCDCSCGLPTLPRLPQPQLPPPFVYPQFPTYPSGSYVTPNGNNMRQIENRYLKQQSFPYQTPLSISNQLHPSYQGAGAQGYSSKQLEQLSDTSNGYATGPYGVENGNFGDYSSTYSLPQIGQSENRFGAQPLSGIGQYMRGPFNNAPQSDISNDPVAVTADTIGIEHNSSSATGEYEKKTKHF